VKRENQRENNLNQIYKPYFLNKNMEQEIEQFLDEQDEIIAPIRRQLAFTYWDAAITGKQEYYDEYERLGVELEKIFNNKETFEKIKQYLKQDIENPIIKRRLQLLYNNYLGSQGDMELMKEIIKISTKIERDFNTYRSKINEKEYTDNEIKDILKQETDSEKLKQAWEASKKQGEAVEQDLIKLIKLRNKLAKSLGFDNYYTLSLTVSEQSEKEIEEIFNELTNLTNEPFKKLKDEIDEYLSKRCNISKQKLKPWHYQDLFFQMEPKVFNVDLDEIYSKDILEITKKFYESIGFDINDILEKSDLYERPGKYPHACCIDMDRKGDVRTLQNIKNNEKWMETMLHELGHSIYNKTIGPISYEELPFTLRWPAHIFTTEAIALLFGRLSKNKAFIKKYCDVSSEEADKIGEELIKVLRARELIFARWSQVMFNFERQLYKNPDQDLNKLWWEMVKKYQLINFSRDKADWASKIHFVSSPVYYHNYLLGDLLASQLNNYIGKNILYTEEINNLDYSDKPEIAEFLKQKVFSVGRKYKWDEMIKMATGEELNPEYFVKQFVGKE